MSDTGRTARFHGWRLSWHGLVTRLRLAAAAGVSACLPVALIAVPASASTSHQVMAARGQSVSHSRAYKASSPKGTSTPGHGHAKITESPLSTGKRPAGSPAPPPASPRKPAKTAAPTVTSAQGDSLTIASPSLGSLTTSSGFYTDIVYSYYENCDAPTLAYGGNFIPWCAQITAYDATNGSNVPLTNAQTDQIYDACGTLVDQQSTYDWGSVGYGYLISPAIIGSYPSLIPTSGTCYGQWTLTFTFSETFSDGDTLTVSSSSAFTMYPSFSTALANAGGDAAVHGVPCSTPLPVNCASGDFWHSFTDVKVPGRGSALDLTRTYNSLSASAEGIFGYGWTSSYEMNLAASSSSVTVTEQDGSQLTAEPDSSGGWAFLPLADSTLTHNADGTWTFVRHQTTTYTFSPAGQLTSITDLNGYATSLSYNSSGQLTTVTDPAGRTITFSYGSNSLVSQLTDPAGQVTSYGYDAAGDLTSVTDPMNRTWSFTYDANHLLLTMTDPDQGTTTNVYNSSAQVTQQTDPAGLVTSFAYSGNPFSYSGGSTTITDPHGNVEVEDYSDGVMTSLTKGYGTATASTWTYTSDPNTLGITETVDPDGHATYSYYDQYGNLTSTSGGPSGSVSYTYNSFDEPLTVRDGVGIVTSYTYDSHGNVLTKTVTGTGGSPVATTTYAYGDSHPGDLTELTDPAGHVTDYAYDAYGDTASVTTHPQAGVNDTTTYVYDVLGRKICEASPTATAAGVSCPAAGQPRVADTTTWAYNADGEVTSITDPLGNATGYHYDGDGSQTQVTDPSGNIITTAYGPDNRKTQVTTGYGTNSASTTAYSYDLKPAASGPCSSSVTGATYCTTTTGSGGQVTVDYFNAQNQKIEQVQPFTGTTAYTYDAAGNLLTQTMPAGVTTYAYDTANRVTSLTYSSPGSGFAAAPNVTYAYDADGHRTQMTDGTGSTTYTYNSLELLSSVTDGAGNTVSYGYDADREITSVTYPGGSRNSPDTVTYTYDGAGRQSQVTDWLGSATKFSYDADGNLLTEGYPNATTAGYTYNAADQVTSVADASNAAPASPFATISYQYNASAGVANETDTGLPGPATQSYSYDPLGRLSSSNAGGYGYDAAGDPAQLPQAAQTFSSSQQVTASSAAISLAGSSSAGDSGSSSSLTVSLPAAAVPGDEVLLALTAPGKSSVKTAPSGYTLVNSYSTGTSASDTAVYLYTHTAQAGDTSATVAFTKATAATATVLVYQGVDTTAPIDVSSDATATAATSVTVPSVTTTAAGDQLVMVAGANSAPAGTWTAPSGMTSEVTQAAGNSISAAAADQALSSAGATGTRTATYSLSGSLVGLLVALRPAQTTYSYDALGDRTVVNAPSGTTTLSYDQLGRLTAYGSIGYTYNGDGLRMSKQVTRHSTESFVWGLSGRSAAPLLLGDGSTYYVYGPGWLPVEQISGSTVLYYLHDQIGSTRALTDSSGSVVAAYSYGPYGNLVATTGSAANPIGFTGAYTDSESGYLYLDRRYYDPATAQFLSVDPLLQDGGQPYVYAGDNPLVFIDPSGLGLFDDILGAVGITLGVAAALTGVGAIVDLGVAADLAAAAGEADTLAEFGSLLNEAVSANLEADALGTATRYLAYGAAATDLPGCLGGSASACLGLGLGLASLGVDKIGESLLWKFLSEGLGVLGTTWDALNYYRSLCG